MTRPAYLSASETGSTVVDPAPREEGRPPVSRPCVPPAGGVGPVVGPSLSPSPPPYLDVPRWSGEAWRGSHGLGERPERPPRKNAFSFLKMIILMLQLEIW